MGLVKNYINIDFQEIVMYEDATNDMKELIKYKNGKQSQLCHFSQLSIRHNQYYLTFIRKVLN